MFLEISQNSQESTCVRVSFWIKLLNSACNFIKKETLSQVFSCEFCKIFKNTLFTEHLRTTASEWKRSNWFVIEMRRLKYKQNLVFSSVCQIKIKILQLIFWWFQWFRKLMKEFPRGGFKRCFFTMWFWHLHRLNCSRGAVQNASTKVFCCRFVINVKSKPSLQ